MVPSLDHFQGKNKNCASFARMISASSHRSCGDTLLSLGAAQAPPNENGIDLRLINFDNHPIFKIVILRKENFFNPECGSKVVKFSKSDRLDALIILARDEQFLFFHWKLSKGGTIGWFLPIFYCLKPCILSVNESCLIKISNDECYTYFTVVFCQ